MAGMRLAAPLLALRSGQSELAVGVMLALFALTQVFLALPAGRYTDRHGLRRPVIAAVVVACLGAALPAIWPEFWALCVAALCTGGATGLMVIASQRYVGRAAADALALKKVFGWLSVGPAVSNFVGPLAAGLLIDYSGFRAAFVFLALLPLLCWYWVRDTPELPRGEIPAITADTPKPSAWDLLQNPAMRRLLLVNWFLSSCWDVHTFVVPVLGHSRDYSASTIGTILGVFAIAAAVVRMFIPVMARHLREWAVITGAMLASSIVFGLYPLMPNPLTMGLCSLVLGVFLGSVQPMVMSSLHHITPPHRQGEALGLRLMTINASSVALPMLFGTLSAVVGVKFIFWGVAVVVGLGARAALRIEGAPQGSEAIKPTTKTTDLNA